MEIKIPGVQLLRKRSDRGDPISASTERQLSTTIIMSNSWKDSLQQATQSGMTTVLQDNEKECLANARLVSLYARGFGKGQRSFIGPGSENKWHSISEDSPQGAWDNMAERMLVEFAESGCPIIRATSPLSRGQLKSKGRGTLLIHCAADLETVETIFRIIVLLQTSSIFTEQSRRCVKSMNPFTREREDLL